MRAVIERIRAEADRAEIECDCVSCIGYVEGMHRAADMIEQALTTDSK